jgi:hypothetical protein
VLSRIIVEGRSTGKHCVIDSLYLPLMVPLRLIQHTKANPQIVDSVDTV